jgi:hypothetical protein
MSRRAARRKGQRPPGEVALDVSIIALGVLVVALALSMLVRAVFLRPQNGERTTAAHAEARIGGGDVAPVAGAAGGTARPGPGAAREGTSGSTAVAPAGIRVQVQNGCGVSGAGIKLASVLRRAGGFDVVDIGNADAFDFDCTVVVDRIGDGIAARAVARALGDAPIVRQRQPDRPYAVTVIVGYDGGRWKKALAGSTP